MRILVLGGMHGNERLGIDLVQLLQMKPIEGVDALIANPRAVARNVRFTESDLNRSFGMQVKDTYETRRAEWLMQKTSQYDVVLDFHNTQTANNNCCFVGEDYDAMLGTICSQLGFSRLVEATYDCVNRYCRNTLSLEISEGDGLDSAEVWRDLIQAIGNEPPQNSKPVKKYRYLQRITWQEKEQFNLGGWRPFVQLSADDKNRLCVKGEIVPIFVGSKLTEFYATLLEYKEEE